MSSSFLPWARTTICLKRIARFFRSVAEHQRADVVLGCPFGNLGGDLGTLDAVIRDRLRQVFGGY